MSKKSNLIPFEWKELMILMGMCHAQKKTENTKVVYDVDPISNHLSRTLHRHIRRFIFLLLFIQTSNRVTFTFSSVLAI